MTKRKRTNQKKTHPKLYQNKRSLATTQLLKVIGKEEKHAVSVLYRGCVLFCCRFQRTHNIVANMLRTLTIPLPIFGKGIFSSC